MVRRELRIRACALELQRAVSYTCMNGSLAALLPDRTLRRWNQDLADHFWFVPSFSVVPLGLRHVHVFLYNAQERLARFPYAVEGAWVTPDFGTRVLYLHCLVPQVHQGLVRELLLAQADGGACTQVEWIPTQEGWHTAELGEPVCAPPTAASSTRAVPSDLRLCIPVLFESWHERLPVWEVWQRIVRRLGKNVQQYAPRKRLRFGYGRVHVREAYAALSRAGLFRQFLITYAPLTHATLHVIIVHPAETASLIPARVREEFLGPEVHVMRAHPSYTAFQQLSTLGREEDLSVFFVQERIPTRFAYERLFDPRTSEWVFCKDHVLAQIS